MDIVLVHGAGGRPTTWSEVEPLLAARGHRTVAVTNPLTSLDEDVAHTTTVIEKFIEESIEKATGSLPGGPLLLVGHSYGGAVITNAGRHPAVRGLVYIAAFGPDEGETVNGIVERYEPAEISAFMRRGPNGEWKSEPSEEFWAEIGPDLSPAQRAVVEAEGRKAENLIFTQPTGKPAWDTLPAWYLVADDDRTLRPDAQRDMAARMKAVTEHVPGSHYTTLVHPQRVADLIHTAATAVSGTS
ncbi:alpha/beta hydrolase [Streptomyces aurantiacus]|uniref:Alpha/beta hydrolase n=1 Tax=Streptomyces aurantiacus TaxID=47760 RepID=A0A7G1NRC0_9ACTN|nr:alpha/beta hydrolase [Streptomyces aurantiacus]BCL25379.1 alpha/beta hydrolase [Streptomyces aurantiacus]